MGSTQHNFPLRVGNSVCSSHNTMRTKPVENPLQFPLCFNRSDRSIRIGKVVLIGRRHCAQNEVLILILRSEQQRRTQRGRHGGTQPNTPRPTPAFFFQNPALTEGTLSHMRAKWDQPYNFQVKVPSPGVGFPKPFLWVLPSSERLVCAVSRAVASI